MRSASLAGLIAIVLLVACSKEPAPAAAPPAPKAAYGSFGVDLAQMDTSVQPGDDFYRYVNGKWLDSFPMPADRASYGTGTVVFEKTEADLHAILDELAATKPAQGSVDQKVADIYASWMDEAGIEARGLEPLQPYLSRIAAAKDKAGLMQLVGSIDFQAPFAVGISPDTVDPTRYAVWVGQSGLGMPNRDYYLKKGEKFDAYRAAYATYVAKIFELLGNKDPSGSAKRVIGIENKIAAVAWAPERQRKVSEAINPMDLGGLKRLAPNVDWPLVLGGVGLGDSQHFVVQETTAIRDGAKLLDSEPLGAWKDYMTFHFVNSYATDLPKAFDEAQFDFNSKALRGVEKQRDRWKRGLTLVDWRHRRRLGEIYVRKHFPPETKAKMDALVANLRAALKERLADARVDGRHDARGSGEEARCLRAAHRLSDKWRDYSALSVERGKQFENVTQRAGVRLGASGQAHARAGRSQRMVHDAADGRCLLRSVRRIRSRSPRASCSRRSSIRTPTRQSTTARSARSSATRSVTASTTRAASSTAPARYATGGRRRPTHDSSRRPRSSAPCTRRIARSKAPA
jgi:endothelin-converting enzyme/putative endopeptidase